MDVHFIGQQSFAPFLDGAWNDQDGVVMEVHGETESQVAEINFHWVVHFVNQQHLHFIHWEVLAEWLR